MLKKFIILSLFFNFSSIYSQVVPLNLNSSSNTQKLNLKTVGGNVQRSSHSSSSNKLCVQNLNKFERKDVYLFYNNKFVKRISIGGQSSDCFKIGKHESSYNWKFSTSMNGHKSIFDSNGTGTIFN